MIDRLNFFDLYGYLIPGLVLTIVLALPYAVTHPEALPNIEFGSGLLVVVVAYVLGHQVHGLGEMTLVSRMMVGGKLLYFSDFILYAGDPTNTFRSDEAREELCDTIEQYFAHPTGAAKASLATKSTGEKGAVKKPTTHLRFLGCRAALLQRKYASYAEQYQGMYVLARGVALGCALGACHLIGWLSVLWPVGSWLPAPVLTFTSKSTLHALLLWPSVSGVIGAAGLLAWVKHWTGMASIPRWLALVPRELRRTILGIEAGSTFQDAKRQLEKRTAQALVAGLALFLALVGRQAAQWSMISPVRDLLLVALFSYVLVGLRSYAAFRHFALEFATAVYRDFQVMVRGPQPKSEG